MRRMWLIARREMAAYGSLPSFWIALLLGPVLMLLTGLIGAYGASRTEAPAAAQTVLIRAADPALGSAVIAAIADANRRAPPQLRVLTPAQAATPDTVLVVSAKPGSALEVLVQGRPIPPMAAAQLEKELLTGLRRQALREAGASQQALDAADAVHVQVVTAKAPVRKMSPAAAEQISRFAIVMLLWMNLVGALGMLLQAIVRERANRALDSLLASARSTEIIFGKLLGVGILSVVVLAAWLGAGAAIAVSRFGAAQPGLEALLLGAFTNPSTLIQAGAVYLVAFAMYGSALIGLGAVAKDLPAAQNLSRPIFGVLLLVFFVALTQMTGAVGPMPWLIWLPPFTPFAILMSPPGATPVGEVIAALVLMLATTVVIAGAASMALTETPLRWRKKRRDASANSRLRYP